MAVVRSFAEVEDVIISTARQLYSDPTRVVLPDGVTGSVGTTGLERLATEADRAIEAAGVRSTPCGALLRPRKAITVMLVGNHSAGKSSLANFLAGARVQEESAPVETRGFSLITAAGTADGGRRTGRSPVVRIRGRLAVQRASHLALALAASPEAIAAASLRSHSEAGPMTALETDREGDSETQGSTSSASVADLKAVAKLATWTQNDNNHFQDLFDIAFVATSKSSPGVLSGGGSRSSTPVSVGPRSTADRSEPHTGAELSSPSDKDASRAGTPLSRRPLASSIDESLPAAYPAAVFGHLAPRGKLSDSPPPVAGVDVIDTPGLVDGSIGYPFDPRAALVRVALCADVIIVTMDPVGQSLCSRTLNAVRALNQAGHGEKMVYCLTKADTVPNDEQMAKLVAQMSPAVVANMADTHGFHLHPMWLPAVARPGGIAIPGWAALHKQLGRLGTAGTARGVGFEGYRGDMGSVSATQNQLGRVLEKIEAARAARAQAALRTLKGDANRVSRRLLSAAQAQRGRVAVNASRSGLQLVLIWAWLALLMLASCAMLSSLAEAGVLPASLLFRAIHPGANEAVSPDAFNDDMLGDWSMFPKCGLRLSRRRAGDEVFDEADADSFEPVSAAAVLAGPLCGVGSVLSSLAGLASAASTGTAESAALARVWSGLASVGVLAVMAGVIALVWSLVQWRKRSAGALEDDEIRSLEWRARAAAVMHQCGRALEDRLVLAAQRDGEGIEPGVLDTEAEWGASVEDTTVEDAAFAATPAAPAAASRGTAVRDAMKEALVAADQQSSAMETATAPVHGGGVDEADEEAEEEEHDTGGIHKRQTAGERDQDQVASSD